MQLLDGMTLIGQEALRHQALLRKAIEVHLEICALAMLIAASLGVPLGFACSKNRMMAQGIYGVFNTVRVIPGLALLAFLIPFLGTGMVPAITALVILAMPSVLLNTATGFHQVDATTTAVAKGLGLNELQIFRRVQFPVALPYILTGLRIASVEVIAGATLAAFIGGGGLGTLIVNGLSTYNFALLLVGALPVAILAMAVEFAFNQWTKSITRYQAC